MLNRKQRSGGNTKNIIKLVRGSGAAGFIVRMVGGIVNGAGVGHNVSIGIGSVSRVLVCYKDHLPILYLFFG